MTKSDSLEAPRLTKKEYELLLYIEQNYYASGTVSSLEQLEARDIKIDPNFYYECFSKAKFVNGLVARGIPRPLLLAGSPEYRTKHDISAHVLTEQQMAVANALLSVVDKRSRTKKLTEMGVSVNTYETWLRNPAYREYCLQRSEMLLKENQPNVTMALVNRASAGDMNAIKYFNALTGRYVEPTSGGSGTHVEVNFNGDDDRKLLHNIVEIIQRHVKDPEALEAIAKDILQARNDIQETKRVLSGRSA